MTRLRVGTRGSELAVWQADWVCEALRLAHPGVDVQKIIVKTHGDADLSSPFGGDWPVGAFVSALEHALMEGEIDVAVHSYKDLQTAVTTGLFVAAVPARAEVHDVLLSRAPVDIEALADGFRVGTGSPRRSAQLRRLGKVEIVPIRGKVQTRIEKIETENLDGIVLAAAGLKRLGISYAHMTELPVDRVVPSPAQGALAIQTRADGEARVRVGALDDPSTRRQVTAERAFLKAIEAGCHTPVGALARLEDERVHLHAQLFDDAGEYRVEGTETGTDPETVGIALARELLRQLSNR